MYKQKQLEIKDLALGNQHSWFPLFSFKNPSTFTHLVTLVTVCSRFTTCILVSLFLMFVRFSVHQTFRWKTFPESLLFLEPCLSRSSSVCPGVMSCSTLTLLREVLACTQPTAKQMLPLRCCCCADGVSQCGLFQPHTSCRLGICERLCRESVLPFTIHYG